MVHKFFEVRDHATCILVLAIKPGNQSPEGDFERWAWYRTGYGKTYAQQQQYVLLFSLDGTKVFHDPYSWESSTMRQAHLYIREYFWDLESGQVLDLRVIRGEAKEAVISERHDHH